MKMKIIDHHKIDYHNIDHPKINRKMVMRRACRNSSRSPVNWRTISRKGRRRTKKTMHTIRMDRLNGTPVIQKEYRRGVLDTKHASGNKTNLQFQLFQAKNRNFGGTIERRRQIPCVRSRKKKKETRIEEFCADGSMRTTRALV